MLIALYDIQLVVYVLLGGLSASICAHNMSL